MDTWQAVSALQLGATYGILLVIAGLILYILFLLAVASQRSDGPDWGVGLVTHAAVRSHRYRAGKHRLGHVGQHWASA